MRVDRSKTMPRWAYCRQVKLAFSRPSKPTDNPFIEAFNGRFRQECLDQNWFASLDDARTIIEIWRLDYNTVRSHTALDQLTPAAFKEHWLQQQFLGAGQARTSLTFHLEQFWGADHSVHSKVERTYTNSFRFLQSQIE